MKRILVTYATMAGSTADVAKTVGDEIAKSGAQVDVLPLGEVKDLAAYDGVVVGAPMIMGWHRAARRLPQATPGGLSAHSAGGVRHGDEPDADRRNERGWRAGHVWTKNCPNRPKPKAI